MQGAAILRVLVLGSENFPTQAIRNCECGKGLRVPKVSQRDVKTPPLCAAEFGVKIAYRKNGKISFPERVPKKAPWGGTLARFSVEGEFFYGMVSCCPT